MLRAVPILAVLLLAQDSDKGLEKAIVDEGLDRSRVMTHLKHLTQQVGPRLTSSDNLTRAQRWAKGQFEKWGLEAKLEEWGTFPVGFNRGVSVGRIVQPTEEDLIFTTNAWTAGTQGPVTAKAMLAPKDLEGDLSKYKDAWVVGWPSRNIRTALYEAGVAGLVRGSRDELVRVGGNYRISWDDLPTEIAIRVVKTQYEKITGLLKEGKEVTLQFDIRNRFKKGPIKLYNVIADIRGTEFPDEYVIVGAHIDSWDAAQGATDNGTGASTAMEAARLLAKAGARPKRTVRFMLWSGEEQGLLGSRAWVKQNPEVLGRISCVFVHDGGTNYLSGISGTRSQAPIFREVFKLAGKLNPNLPFEVNEIERLSSGSSDHASFLQAGVPGFFWRQSGRAVYRYGWHTQNDRYDLAIEEYQKQSSLVIALGALGIANLDSLLPRDNLKARAPGEGPRRIGIGTDEDGVTITSISEGSAAEKAGLKVGDKILKIGSIQVKDNDTLRNARDAAPKKTTVEFERKGETQTLPINFGS